MMMDLIVYAKFGVEYTDTDIFCRSLTDNMIGIAEHAILLTKIHSPKFVAIL